MRMRVVALSVCLTVSNQAQAWEADVHYGLTYWLALQAGFTEQEAGVIASGDARVDSGDIQFVAPLFDYACVGTDAAAFSRAGRLHFPTSSQSSQEGGKERVVTAGGAAARAQVDQVVAAAKSGKASFLLQRLGETLHPLQDSWSNQGKVGPLPTPALPFDCKPERLWIHPAERGGWSSHRADLTTPWPKETLEMARATYEVLTSYPQAAQKRPPRQWSEVAYGVAAFAQTDTKAEKATWFKANGVGNVSFLEGISLPDGKEIFADRWDGRKYPKAPPNQARQPHLDTAQLDFFHGFMGAWLGTSDFQALVNRFGVPKNSGNADLASRLQGWRIRDHGRVTDALHDGKALSAPQRAAIAAAAKAGGLASYDSVADATIPILPDTGTTEVSPLLPFVIRPFGNDGTHAAAIVKLRHVPYDTLAIIAEKIGKGWRVVGVSSVVDH